MKRILKRIIITALFTAVTISAYALTGEEIVRLADEQQTFDTSYSVGEMRITDRFGEKVTTFKSWSRGSEESLIEFTSVAERGQKILRTEDALYLYYPDASEIIRMQGAALRQSMLGSDISYEDMTGGKDRISQYDVTLIGEETVEGRACYVLELVATTRTVPYPQEKVWIDKEHFLLWKGEYSTKSGRLLKTIETLEAEEIDGRMLPTESRIVDAMKQDSQTLLIIDEIDVNIQLDESIFSLQELSW
jgi:outer membrane lipoprotein-sorting protein